MSLLQLSPELLMHIMVDVGSSYFREDIRRLTICKQWYSFAIVVFFRHLRLSEKTLERLLSSERNLLLIKENSETLDIELKGLEDWDLIPEPQEIADAVASSSCLIDLAMWTKVLEHPLAQLANTVKESSRLREIHIRAFSKINALNPYLPRRDYLPLTTIRAFLQVENLKVLDLDLCGTGLKSPEAHPEDFHICESIGALLPRLKRLRLRMRNICADVLRPRNHRGFLHLEEVVINLSLSNESPMITSVTHPMRCISMGSIGGGGFLDLREEMGNQAKKLALRMVSPKIVRILVHKYPDLRIRSLDVLTGKCMELDDDMAWGDDGKIIEDEVYSEPESEIMSGDSDDSDD